MSELLVAVADLLVLAGLAVGGATWWATRSWSQGLGILLDLVLAATLLRLSGSPEWPTLLTTAAVVALRVGLRHALPMTERARRDAAATG